MLPRPWINVLCVVEYKKAFYELAYVDTFIENASDKNSLPIDIMWPLYHSQQVPILFEGCWAVQRRE